MIAKGGRAFVGLSALAVAAALPFSFVAAACLSGLAIFLLLVFRDPGRRVGDGIVSPADGTVREVDPQKGLVSIYLALRNVHVTRAPAQSRIDSIRRSPGTHAPAFSRKTLGNERAELSLDSIHGKIMVVEMTGAIARRIVLYVRDGDALAKGQKLGLIRFGSRVDVFLPPGATISVTKGTKVKAGVTTIAEVRDGSLE